MATAREDAKTQELNLIFKSLGGRGNEGDIWKEFTEHTLCYLLQQTPEFIHSKALGNESIKSIMFRLYSRKQTLIFNSKLWFPKKKITTSIFKNNSDFRKRKKTNSDFRKKQPLFPVNTDALWSFRAFICKNLNE